MDWSGRDHLQGHDGTRGETKRGVRDEGPAAETLGEDLISNLRSPGNDSQSDFKRLGPFRPSIVPDRKSTEM